MEVTISVRAGPGLTVLVGQDATNGPGNIDLRTCCPSAVCASVERGTNHRSAATPCRPGTAAQEGSQ